MAKIKSKIIEMSLIKILLFMIIINIILTLVTVIFIMDYSFFRKLFKNLSEKDLIKFYTLKERYTWILYIITPLVFLIKALFVSLCLKIGAILREYIISYNTLLKIALLCESIFIISKTINITFHFLHQTNTDISFSLLSLFDGVISSYPWLVGSLSILNLYEFIFAIGLIFFIKHVINKSYPKIMGFVVTYYGGGLLLWLLILVSINLYIMG